MKLLILPEHMFIIKKTVALQCLSKANHLIAHILQTPLTTQDTLHRQGSPEGCLWRNRGRTLASLDDQYPRWLCRVCYGWNTARTCVEQAGVWEDSCESPSCLVKPIQSTFCSPDSENTQQKLYKTMQKRMQ